MRSIRFDEGVTPGPCGCLHSLTQRCLTEAVDLLGVWESQHKPCLSPPWAQVPKPGKVVSGELIRAAFKLQDQGAHPSSQFRVRVELA